MESKPTTGHEVVLQICWPGTRMSPAGEERIFCSNCLCKSLKGACQNIGNQAQSRFHWTLSIPIITKVKYRSQFDKGGCLILVAKGRKRSWQMPIPSLLCPSATWYGCCISLNSLPMLRLELPSAQSLETADNCKILRKEAVLSPISANPDQISSRRLAFLSLCHRRADAYFVVPLYNQFTINSQLQVTLFRLQAELVAYNLQACCREA